MSTKDFAKIIRERLKKDPDLTEAVEEADFNVEIALQIYTARNEAGLTQQELAEQLDTRQSAISRMEDADYGKHSLSMLKRIATALNKRLHIEFRQRIHEERVEANTLSFVFVGDAWESNVCYEPRPIVKDDVRVSNVWNVWVSDACWETATAIGQEQEEGRVT